MKRDKNKSGFTLLEIIIVIIIVGILASLAMPKFFKTVEYSRATEALGSLGAIRRAMDICYQPTQSYAPCTDFTRLSIEDPGAMTGAHWTYAWTIAPPSAFVITATRNALNGGVAADTITINQNGAKTGTGNFQNIQ